ncbi:lipocalin-like domain-containing protein [Aequorivita echinoideorum]|uniref:Lipocalin-like domain-containing protein n=1 Tax=Aequorivita echinoideorum TaxID=1549647 RepID=A0ABS5S5Y6_9FLAO|nr:lipocalin-like domain-containing protein [Aequorivita echinoideorum]MBT0608631.1 lipocalin-like domain-containing protein [Aequorivita echinoideorum]
MFDRVKIIFLLIIFCGSLIGCREETRTVSREKITKKDITGMWKLESMKVRDTATNIWKHYRGGMDGYLLYDGSGHVALHLYEKGYENTALEFANFSDAIPLESLKHLTKSYYYMGNYSVSDSIVSHFKLSHSNPKEFGDTAERKFHFRGDTLVLEPVESQNANLQLKLLRNKSSNL